MRRHGRRFVGVAFQQGAWVLPSRAVGLEHPTNRKEAAPGLLQAGTGAIRWLYPLTMSTMCGLRYMYL